ncbi:transcriptional regulator [Lentisalinibacter sediminis]|uniref:transcriptional regulator n=1 Tax=Lentisalinibacter sediminis TaxID=2992237 RepID=UPI0038693A05
MPKSSPGPADALFTTTQQRVLGLLFGQSDRSFFKSELIRLARMGSGTVQREVERLVASGLVSVTTIGRQKHYRANSRSPIFGELRSLARKTIGIAEPLRSALAPLAPRVRLAMVAGSGDVATGAAPKAFRLLLVGDRLTLEQIHTALAPVEERFGRQIHPTLYTAEKFRRERFLESGFAHEVLTGDRVVVIRSGPISGI